MKTGVGGAARAVHVAFDAGRGGFVADGALLPGAHATVARLVAASRAPASARGAVAGMAGVSVGARVHAELERFFASGAPAAHEHPLTAALRAALLPHLRGAATHPEVAVAAPSLGFATSVDLVAAARGRFVVAEYKTGYLATFDTAVAGRWRAAVAPALLAARIDCTPGGRAAVQGFLGALAFAETFAVPLEHITVVVARVWHAGTACTSLRAYPLATPAFGAVAAALRRALSRRARQTCHGQRGLGRRRDAARRR